MLSLSMAAGMNYTAGDHFDFHDPTDYHPRILADDSTDISPDSYTNGTQYKKPQFKLAYHLSGHTLNGGSG